MRRLKNPNQWPPGGWNFEEPSTGFRFRGSSLQDLALGHRCQILSRCEWGCQLLKGDDFSDNNSLMASPYVERVVDEEFFPLGCFIHSHI